MILIYIYNNCNIYIKWIVTQITFSPVEYTDWISAEEWDSIAKEYPGYDTKLSDGEALVLDLRGKWNNHSLPLLPGPLWTRVVVPVRVASMGQLELFKHFLYLKSFNCANKWSLGQVGWGCRIHKLHLCTGVKPPATTTSVLDMTLNNLMVRLQ